MQVLHRCRAYIYDGFGLPVLGDVRVAISHANVRHFGQHRRVVPEALKAAGGRCEFMEVSILPLNARISRACCGGVSQLRRVRLIFFAVPQVLFPPDPTVAPEDPRDAPDVFIELWDTPATKLTAPTLLAFTRFNCVDLCPRSKEDRGERAVEWRELTHGPGWDPHAPPAWLQMRVELSRGPEAVVPKVAPLYRHPTTTYRFRATIYQARYLPASRNARAADPYVVLRGASSTMFTSVKTDTTFPLWCACARCCLREPSASFRPPCYPCSTGRCPTSVWRINHHHHPAGTDRSTDPHGITHAPPMIDRHPSGGSPSRTESSFRSTSSSRRRCPSWFWTRTTR